MRSVDCIQPLNHVFQGILHRLRGVSQFLGRFLMAEQAIAPKCISGIGGKEKWSVKCLFDLFSCQEFLRRVLSRVIFVIQKP